MTNPLFRKLSIARIPVVLALTAQVLLAPLSAHAAEEVSGSVTVTGFYGLFQDRFTESVIQPFEKKYPNIKVIYKPVKNSAEAIGLLRLQKQNPSLDVAIVDISIATLGNSEKIFGGLNPAIVTNLKDVAPWGRLPENHGAALTTDNLAIVYNTKQLKTAPKSIADLWNPEYRNRLTLPIADTRGVALIPILDRMAGADYKTTIDPAIAKLKTLAPAVQTWDPQPEVYTAIRAGSSAIGVAWNARGQYTRDISQGEVDVAIPSEGTVSQINTINLVGNAPNAGAAQLFINYALSVEAQTKFAESSFYGPTNSKVKLSEAIAKRIYGDAKIQNQVIHLDWAWLSEKYAGWVQRIKREVIGG